MHEIGSIPTTNMMYTRLQNYTNMVVGKHELHTFEVVVVVFLFDVFVPRSAHPLVFFGQVVSPNILKRQFQVHMQIHMDTLGCKYILCILIINVQHEYIFIFSLT